MEDAEIAQAIDRLLHRRGTGKTICPSEVARDLATDWRPLMPRIRDIAANMAGIEATQKGVPVDPRAAHGPIRLGRSCMR